MKKSKVLVDGAVKQCKDEVAIHVTFFLFFQKRLAFAARVARVKARPG